MSFAIPAPTTGAAGAQMIPGLPAPVRSCRRNRHPLPGWRYAGSGHRHGEPFWAEPARQRIATARKIAKERAHPEME